MNCFTSEELAGIILDLEPDRPLPPHIHECYACSAKLEELTQLHQQLSQLHAAIGRGHEDSRTELMKRLATVELSAQATRWFQWPVPSLQRLTMWQRVVIGSLGLSTVVAIVVVMLAFGTTKRASAMERMIARLREVTSFQYSLHDMSRLTHEGAEEPVTVEHVGTFWWQAPRSVRETGLIIKYPANSPPLERKYRLHERFEAILPTGKSGIVIDHLRKAVRWVPEFRGDFLKDSPVTKLRMVRNRDGEMVRELGTKMIDGKQAHGFVMRLDGAEEGSGLDALAVWVNPDTDLPLEFEYEYEAEWGAYSFRLYDCRWNLQLVPQLFVAEAPENYTDTTPPKSQASLDQITDALRLYAKLSGGHYLRVEFFYGDAVHKEMLQMADFSGEPQAGWAENKQYQQVQQTIEGLDWLTRILRGLHRAGYFGETVGVDDRDKVLLWWEVDPGESYRVFYGDLETEVVEHDWWERLREGGSPRDHSR